MSCDGIFTQLNNFPVFYCQRTIDIRHSCPLSPDGNLIGMVYTDLFSLQLSLKKRFKEIVVVSIRCEVGTWVSFSVYMGFLRKQ